MDRGRTPAEVWMVTPEEVDFLFPYISYESYMLFKKKRGGI
jgi:hypothetical protein